MSLDPSTLVWMIINFLLLMVLLNKFLFKPMLAFMKQRQDKIDAGIRAGEEAEKLLEQKSAELAAGVTEARKKAEEQIHTASKEIVSKNDELEAENAAYIRSCLTEIAGALFDEEEQLAAAAEQHMPEYVAILQNKLKVLGPAKAIQQKSAAEVPVLTEEQKAEKKAKRPAEAAKPIHVVSGQLSNKSTVVQTKNSAYSDSKLAEIVNYLYAEQERLATAAEDHMPEYVTILQDKLMSSGPAKSILVNDTEARDMVLSILARRGEMA